MRHSRALPFPHRPRVTRLAMIAALTAALAWPAFSTRAAKVNLEEYEVGSYEIGGDFALTNQDGNKTGLKDYRGKVVVMFFGYTHCPDVCPLTLTEMSRLNKLLGADAAKVQPVFITVDPARDTAERLKTYLSNFEGGIVGLTGTPRDITQVAKLFRTKFAKRNEGSAAGYLVDHTAFIYLVDPKGKVRYLVPFDAGTDVLAEGAKRLLRG